VSGTALERNFKTLLQIVRQRTRFVRRREHEVPLRREHRNSIRSRHFINGSSPITHGDHIWGTLAESRAPLYCFGREIARAMNAAIALPVGAGSPLLDEAEFTTRKSSWKPHNLSRPLPAS
jgi:hypothetical protein